MVGILILTIFNTLLILSLGITIGVIYFKNNYIILDIPTYQSLINQQEPELISSGGCGFFKEYIEDQEDDN